jgi:hypothetical protein
MGITKRVRLYKLTSIHNTTYHHLPHRPTIDEIEPYPEIVRAHNPYRNKQEVKFLPHIVCLGPASA